MRALLASAVAVAAFGIAGAAAAAPSVQFKNAVARVTVIPEARTDVKVEFVTTNASLPLTVETHGDRVVVEGGLKHGRVHGCRTVNGKTSISVRGVGNVDWDNIPQVVVRTPMNVDVGAAGAVFGNIGRADSVDLANAGCGDWVVANVKGDMSISNAGSGDTRVGSVGRLDANIAGSGDIWTQAVAGPAEVNIAGSGDVNMASVNGNLDVSVAGSGDVNVQGGRADRMEVNIAGSGDTNFRGVVGSLEANIMGSGDVHVGQVTGSTQKSVMGSGSVIVGN